MTERIELEKLEAVNDLLADGIDAAGEASEVFLAKVAYYLGTHYCEIEQMREAVNVCLDDLSHDPRRDTGAGGAHDRSLEQ